MSNFFIYMISNDINNKVYIEQTARKIEKRFEEHCNCSLSPISRAIQSIGREHFMISLLDDTATNLDELTKLEESYIKKYNSIENGYNSKPASKARELVIDNKTGVLINMDKTLKAQLERLAKEDSRSLTNYIAMILQNHVEHIQKKDKQ